jgi:hypothetical protein
MMSDTTFGERIEGLDITLFSQILSQTTDADRRSLLAVQICIRECVNSYVYLEIGSHLGGSIQPHLLDSKCEKIFSIDKRPSIQPDERGPAYGYPGNSTKRMLSLLTAIDSEKVVKIECIDGDTKSISPLRISVAPDLCFIDGEHTPEAVMTDFDFCRRVCAENATILFHDRRIVFRGLRSVISKLDREGCSFSAHAMSDEVYVICLDRSVVPERLARFSSLVSEDDLWSRRNDLRLLKWRALTFKERVSILGTKLLGRI